MVEESKTKTFEDFENKLDDKLSKGGNIPSWGRLIFLGILGMALCNFGPFAMFAPAPLALAFLLYGSAKSIGLATIISGLLAYIAVMVPGSGFIAFFFVISSLIAFLLSRSIRQGDRPIYGILRSAAALLILIFLVLGSYELLAPMSLYDTILEGVKTSLPTIKEQYAKTIEAGGEEARVIQDLLSEPKKTVDLIFEYAFLWGFVSIVFSLWASMYILLRNGITWKSIVPYAYSIKDLAKFKTPFWMVYPLIASLGLILGATELGGDIYRVVGENILYSLGIFYFFQGFGIFLDLLNLLKIYGFFRGILIFITVLAAFKVMAIVGIFDTWFNFRKYFNKKKET